MPDPIYALNDDADMRVTTRRLEGTNYPLLIVDNIYRDPEAVRRLALSLQYLPSTSGHPGDKAVCEAGDDLDDLHGLIHRHFAVHFGYQRASLPTPAPGQARFNRMHTSEAVLRPWQCQPHVDSPLLAGVVYLNRPEHCRGGTAFYRHCHYQVAEFRVPSSKEVDPVVVTAVQSMGILDTYLAGLEQARWRDYAELQKMLWSPSSLPRDFMANGNPDWERIDMVEMRWNRLVCYPGFVFHSALYSPTWFGESAAARRLTQNLFFSWPEPAARNEMM